MPRVAVARELPVSLREGFDYVMDRRNWEAYWPALVEKRVVTTEVEVDGE